MSRHDIRSTELIAHEAAKYIVQESSGQSLITVTRSALSKNGEKAMIFVSVFPITEARAALTFLSRITGDFRKHLATHAKLHPIPKIEFVHDEGELNRQHLDELSKKL